jgi:hypothetical protein
MRGKDCKGNKGMLKSIVTYLSGKGITWLELLLLFIIGICVYGYNLEEVEFHLDENPWIYESAALDALLTGNFAPEIWDEEFNSMLDPPIPKYLIGIGMKLGGLSIVDLPRWDWHLGTNENIARGCEPSKDMLFWARIPMIVTSISGLLLAAFLLSKAYSRLSAFLFYGFSLTSFTYPLRQAMSESPLIFFTFLAGLVGYLGIIALSDQKFKLAYIRFSIFGVLTGLAAASKLNGIFIAAASILCVGFVLFWNSRGKIKQHLALAVRLVLLQIYLVGITFVSINPFLYTKPIQNTALMFVSRAFTIQVQMIKSSKYAITPENWKRIVPERIFQQYATLAYPGHYAINFILFLIGLYIVFYTILNKNPGWEASLLLGTFSIVLAVPGILTPLDWVRYYLFPVIFARIYIAVGFAKVLSVLTQKVTQKMRVREGVLGSKPEPRV